jgi:predicted nucleic acid-binding protein
LTIYLDTSLLVSLYSPDANSAAASRILQVSTGTLHITPLVELELLNALELRVFRKEISASQAHSSSTAFEQDLRDSVFQLNPLPQNVFLRAGLLSRQTTARFGTRTADVLHVAAALEFQADYFYTFDRQQRRLAQAARLKVNAIP